MPAVPPNDKAITDLQRQLVLAQVRILELEDIRDDAGTRIDELDGLLADLQGKANQALNDHDHLQAAHRDLLEHRNHIQHLLHLANQALADSREQAAQLTAQVEAGSRRENDLRNQLASLNSTVSGLEGRTADLGARILQLEDQVRDQLQRMESLNHTALARAERIAQMDAELRAMKASRSWRWTQPIRAVERWFRRT